MMKPRNLKKRLAGVAVVLAVAIGILAFALTQSSSAQTASKMSTPGDNPPAQIANAQDAVTAVTRGSFGDILISGSGATLYRYDADKPNMPTCTGSCATAWPPLLLPVGTNSAKAGAGLTGVGSVMLSDGRSQVTYNQMPLYTFASDSGTSVDGQGVGGFFVVHPTHTSSATAKTTTTPKTTAPTTAPTTSSGGGYGY
jgi:predicted lipoprotein with Yx(FWY)xxD motif